MSPHLMGYDEKQLKEGRLEVRKAKRLESNVLGKYQSEKKNKLVPATIRSKQEEL